MRRTIALKVRFTGKRRFEEIAASIDALVADPSTLANLLRDIVQQTLLRVYMSRFERSKDVIADMRRADRGASALYRRVYERRIANLERRLSEQLGLSTHKQSGVEEIKGLLRRAQLRLNGESPDEADFTTSNPEALVGEHAGLGVSSAKRKPKGGKGALGSTGVGFRALMEKVMSTIADPARMVVMRSKNRLVLGIGDRSVLDAIHTPSFNPKTATPYKVLWRHMEFGTGVFAKPGPHLHGGAHKEDDGTWWFGTQIGEGIHLRGSRPGNILRKQTGEAYTEDFMKFEARLHLALNRALRGRGA